MHIAEVLVGKKIGELQTGYLRKHASGQIRPKTPVMLPSKRLFNLHRI